MAPPGAGPTAQAKAPRRGAKIAGRRLPATGDTEPLSPVPLEAGGGFECQVGELDAHVAVDELLHRGMDLRVVL